MEYADIISREADLLPLGETSESARLHRIS
jgi:hypothetical protein